MPLSKQQIERLRKMPPEARRAFHTNRIANSLESIVVLLREISGKLGATTQSDAVDESAHQEAASTQESASPHELT